MSLIGESDGSADAAIGYTNEFFDAAVEKIDATFGKGFAKSNPMLIGALVQACSANLNAFMQAAMGIDPTMFDAFEEDPPPPPKRPKGRR
jgi:hypothetical protein